MHLTRRTALLAAAALPFRPAHAARDSVGIRMVRDIRNLDPANRPGAVEANIVKACTQRLVQNQRASFKTELDAAARLDRLEPTVLAFELKPGLTFSGGYGPMTADDVKFSYERFATAGPGGKAAAYAKDWEGLDGVEVIGPLTGRIHLKHPAPAIVNHTLTGGSGCILSRRACEALGPKITQMVVGSGPYTMAEWEPNARVVLRANPDWTGPAPGFSQLMLRPVADLQTAQLALRAGELDFSPIDPGAAPALRSAGAHVSSLESINYVWIGLNADKKPLDDLRVRQAIRLAIDTEQVVQAAYNGQAKTIRALQAPGLLGAWPDAPVYKRDVAAARALLDQAGLPRGTVLRLTLLSTPTYQTAAVIVRAMLADVGIDVQIDARPAGTFWSSGEGAGGRDLEMSLQRFGGEPDPSFQTGWFVSSQIGGWNWQRWNSPEFDRLDSDGRATDDEAERSRIYVQMQRLMDQSAAFIWLTNEASFFASAAWLDPAIQPTGDDLQYPQFRPA